MYGPYDKHFARKYDMAVKEFILSQENNVLKCKKKSLSSFYSYVNSKLTTSQCITPLIDSNDNLAVSNHVLCIMIILLPFLLLMTVCSQNLCLASLKTNP